MRTHLLAGLVSIAVASWPLPITVAGQERSSEPAPVPVEREPRHRPIFANDALRLIELKLPVGDTSLFHTHVYDNLTVRVIASDSRTQTIGGEWGEVSKRATGSIATAEYAGRTTPAHRIQNAGSVPLRQIVVENLRTAGWSTVPPLTATNVTLEQETRAFRAYRVALPSQGVVSEHSHALPVIVVLVSGHVETSGTDKRELLMPGDWVVVPAAARHALTHRGTAAAEIVEVEVR